MFRQAEAESAVLVLDEADGFLRDRNGANRTWEITQVNEFLIQIEAYQGLFIASTNMLDTMDAASLRRFDLKICFHYMKPEQSWLLFVQVMQERGYSEDAFAHDMHQKVIRLTNLTPGDFATALRREHIMGDTFGPGTLVEALEAECSVKPEAAQRGIGFTATL